MRMSLLWVVFDCDDVRKVMRFWAAALEREPPETESDWGSLPGDPHLEFMRVPEGKTTKNRVHLDWAVPDREVDVQRLIGLGATRP